MKLMVIFETLLCWFGCSYFPFKKNVVCHVLFSSITEGVIQNFSTISYGVLLHGTVDAGCPNKFW
jgi:hypothetical protein